MRHLTPLVYIDQVAKAGSIRKAAETLAITPSALNRRILAFEDELGVPIFERLARGVRLNTAGEVLVQHIRGQVADMARVRSQIADLSGVRRGHVAIACSEAVLRSFLPCQIEAYRSAYPGVSFAVLRRESAAAERALSEHAADLALVFEPERFVDFQTIMTIDQPVFAVMAPDHPLAGRDVLRLHDCLPFPLALPPAPDGIRSLLEALAARTNARLDLVVQSDSLEFLINSAAVHGTIAFGPAVGLPREGDPPDPVCRPVDSRDIPPRVLYMGQLRDRVLPVAAARFADQLAAAFVAEYDSG